MNLFLLLATIALSGAANNTRFESVKEALTFEEVAYEKSCGAAKKLDSFIFDKNDLPDIDEATVDKLKEQVTSAKSAICKFYDKTQFLSEKSRRLGKTEMIKDCVDNYQCAQVAPAIRDMNEHFEQRKVFVEAINMTIEMLQDTVPNQRESQITIVQSFSKIIDVIWEYLLQPMLPKIEKYLPYSGGNHAMMIKNAIVLVFITIMFRLGMNAVRFIVDSFRIFSYPWNCLILFNCILA